MPLVGAGTAIYHVSFIVCISDDACDDASHGRLSGHILQRTHKR